MRVTIELPDDLRARVMSMSAQRGYRGYGRLIIEAVEHYLDSLNSNRGTLEKVLKMEGSWSKVEASDARSGVAEARGNYRRLEP